MSRREAEQEEIRSYIRDLQNELEYYQNQARDIEALLDGEWSKLRDLSEDEND